MEKKTEELENKINAQKTPVSEQSKKDTATTIKTRCPGCCADYEISKICPKCNHGDDNTANYCGFCGSKMIQINLNL